jgi:hypothetical protein
VRQWEQSIPTAEKRRIHQRFEVISTFCLLCSTVLHPPHFPCGADFLIDLFHAGTATTHTGNSERRLADFSTASKSAVPATRRERGRWNGTIQIRCRATTARQ